LIDSSKTLLEIDSSNFYYLILSRFLFSVFKDCKIVDNLIWLCGRIETERSRLIEALITLDLPGWNSRTKFVCSEEVADDVVPSKFPRKSWNKNLMTWLSFFKDSWASVTSDLTSPSKKKVSNSFQIAFCIVFFYGGQIVFLIFYAGK
jgi:hypothetical protein